jgi:hypothetical protein
MLHRLHSFTWMEFLLSTLLPSWRYSLNVVVVACMFSIWWMKSDDSPNDTIVQWLASDTYCSLL